MLKNFFKVAIRQLWKHRGYSALNIFGLAMGMACSLLIFLWIRDERSVDAFHVKGNRLFRMYERQFFDRRADGGYYTPGVLPAELKKVFPEVEKATGFDFGSTYTFEVGTKILKEEGGFASQDFFSMFSYPLLEGTAEKALDGISSIAISRKMAVKFFGSPQEAIGKAIRFQNRADFAVTAVFEDLPENVSAKFDYLLNWDFYLKENTWAQDWGNNGPSTMVLLRPDANPDLMDKKLLHFLNKYNKETGKGFDIELHMQPFSEGYLHGHFKEGIIEGGRIEYVRLFSIVAIFILLIACINFMNLTTARSVKRSKEIGIRKVVGAVRPALVRQFIGEAILLSFFSMILAMAVVILVLPGFNMLADKHIHFPFGAPSFWLTMALLTLVTGALSGSYPALFLSSFQPIRVLKGSLKFTAGAAVFRKGLVVFQFLLSIVLIIGTLVVSNQLKFLQSVNSGFERENLVYIHLEGDLVKNYDLFKMGALRLPGVTDVTRITNTPTDIENGTGGVDWDGKEPHTFPMFTQASVGYDFVKTMKLQFVAGRDYSKEYGTDTSGYIINEAALKKIGYKDPIGRRLTFWQRKGTIIGVLKDFHFASLHDPIQPLVIRLGEHEEYGNALIRVEGAKTRQVLSGLETLCHQLNPKFPFTSQFADEQYQRFYASEAIVQHLSGYFAGLAIFIACLGLLGLAMFTAEQRTREFGVRKVLGASVSSLFMLLSRDFLVLVGVAFLLAVPLAWWAMHTWLQSYAYHIGLGWWIFLMAGGMALLIALLTVSIQAFKVAVANPVKSLRSE